MTFEPVPLAVAASRLNMDANELKHVAQRGEVPVVFHGEEMLFPPRPLVEWAQRRLISLKRKQLQGEHVKDMISRRRLEGADLRVSDLLVTSSVALDLSAKNRGGILRDMTDLAESTGMLYDPDTLFKELTSREEAGSTAVGGGAAFLHAKNHDPYLYQETFLALGRSSRPVFFGSQDGEGTDVFFLICATDHLVHLHIIARLCLLAHATNLLEALRAASDAETVCAELKRAEDEFLGTIR